MDLFARLFIKLLDYTYGKKPKPVDDQRDALVDDVFRRAEEEIESHRRQQIVASFKSTAAAPQQGAIDYEGISWNLFTSALETPAQFTFYSDRNIAKVIEKSAFTNPQELVTFRRVVRRQIANCKLLPD